MGDTGFQWYTWRTDGARGESVGFGPQRARLASNPVPQLDFGYAVASAYIFFQKRVDFEIFCFFGDFLRKKNGSHAYLCDSAVWPTFD